MNLYEVTSNVPKTELTYLKQTHLGQTEATILKLVPDKGSHVYVVLDRTIFHPKGGGQPSDRGTIQSNNFRMQIKKAIFHDGVVAHWAKILEGSPLSTTVHCEVDWNYRYLMMRRHTTAHLLDHCLGQVTSSRVQTTDSWLDDPCYVGYAGSTPDIEALARTEALANKMIQTGAKVEIRFLTGADAQETLRSAPNFERLPAMKEVRIVTIDGCQPIPCGGTHVADIKEIEQFTISRAEPIADSGFRVHFTVG